jgi:hypothetical protein
MKFKVNKSILLAALLVGSGCGVKGDPLPPEQVPRLGRGYPTYTKASEQIQPKKTRAPEENEDQE